MLTGATQPRDLARIPRRALSPPETMLWQSFRLRPGGFKFRRQHPAGDYVLDFFRAAASLAIEVDGAAHGFSSRAAFDGRRDEWLGLQDVRCFQVSAADVLKGGSDVVEAVVSICIERAALPLHHAKPHGPPSRSGEGLRTEAPAWTI